MILDMETGTTTQIARGMTSILILMHTQIGTTTQIGMTVYIRTLTMMTGAIMQIMMIATQIGRILTLTLGQTTTMILGGMSILTLGMMTVHMTTIRTMMTGLIIAIPMEITLMPIKTGITYTQTLGVIMATHHM